MPIILQKRYSREEIQANPHIYYVFGDNLTKKGYGGQAAAARDEPNTIGIPTKASPEKPLVDEVDLMMAVLASKAAFSHMENLLGLGCVIIWPMDGVGTGLADLQNIQPKFLDWINLNIRRLYVKYY